MLLKLIVSIVLTIVALFVCKKTDTKINSPANDNDGVIFICLVPTVTYFVISYGALDMTAPFGKTALLALESICSAIWVQLLVVGKGVDYMRSSEDGKIALMEFCPLITIFLMTDCLNGLGYNLLYTLGIAIMTIALYIRTNSLDLSISLHLIMNASRTFTDTFITAHTVDLSTYRILYICNCAFAVIIGLWLLQGVYKSTLSEEGKFNG
ncbi:MAG: hypothetical protein KBS43_05590 [Oscillospiraceae bacterium]|nr:hypothetical protein [Candidatus Limimonas coprohippi]